MQFVTLVLIVNVISIQGLYTKYDFYISVYILKKVNTARYLNAIGLLSSFNLSSDATALIGLIATKVDERLKYKNRSDSIEQKQIH